MQVTDIALLQTAEHTRLNGTIGGVGLWYRFPVGCSVATPGNAFLAAALLAAMSRGEALELPEDAPVSPRVMRGADRIQDVFAMWNPALKKVPIRARECCGESQSAGVAAFFSGGVDATYTLMRHASEITHLIFVWGSDIKLQNEPLYREALRRNLEVAEALGKTLLPVETNFRDLCEAFGISNDVYHAFLFASVALALSFPRTYLASGLTYADSVRWSSNYFTDPLWSTEAMELVHDGAEVPRTEKLRRLSEWPLGLDRLRVCLMNSGYNCGLCEKCLRTMLALRLLGLSSAALPALTRMDGIRSLRISDRAHRGFYVDSRELALRVGDREAAAAIGVVLRRQVIKGALKDLDEALLGGCLRRWRQALRRWRHGGSAEPPWIYDLEGPDATPR